MAEQPKWDVFHSDRLEVERGLAAAEVQAALARGDLRDDDLARPAGTTAPWARLADLPGLLDAPGPEPDDLAGPPPDLDPPAPPTPPDEPAFTALIDDEDESWDEAPAPPVALIDDEDDRLGQVLDEFAHLVDDDEPAPAAVADEPEDDILPPELAEFEPEPGPEPDGEIEDDPQEEDEAAADFSLAPRAGPPLEELDLTAMVDVAFQLILFFLVTATTAYFKTLEVPKPNPDRPDAVAQSMRTLEDLQNDYILVGIDPQGAITIDHEPAPAEPAALAARLRDARERTGRTAMLLTADFTTPHRSAVLAYDAANEIGLRIAIARPRAPGPGQAPPAG